jgi:hypothetical protein
MHASDCFGGWGCEARRYMHRYGSKLRDWLSFSTRAAICDTGAKPPARDCPSLAGLCSHASFVRWFCLGTCVWAFLRQPGSHPYFFQSP